MMMLCSELDGVLPFATDVDDNMLVVSANDMGVYEWDSDGQGRKIASDFESFLEKFRNDLLSNKFEFVSGCGVVEGLGGESKSSK